MKIKMSPLSIRDLAVINFDYGFIPSNKEENLREYFDKYEIDINFALKEYNESTYQLFVKAEINYQDTKQLPGYEIFCECTGIFDVDNSEITAEEKRALLSNSALVITLNFLRFYIASSTSNFPYGKFLLPSLDLKDLLNKRAQLVKKQKNVKPNKKG